jgi:hypothetical protein
MRRRASSCTRTSSSWWAPPSCLNAQGAWQKGRNGVFLISDEGFCFETFSGFPPAGTIQFTATVRLTNDGSDFTGTLHIKGFDADGNLVFSDDAALEGTRIRADGL